MLTAQLQTMDGRMGCTLSQKKTYGDGTNGGGLLVMSPKNKADPVLD